MTDADRNLRCAQRLILMKDAKTLVKRYIAQAGGLWSIGYANIAADLIKANRRIDELEAVLRDDPILWHKANGGE